MKRYCVLSHHLESNEHLNAQDLLPATCRLITGIAVIATAKQVGELKSEQELLTFPQQLITDLLNQEGITELFYSYMRTRSTKEDCRAYFESDILPEYINVLSAGISFSKLSIEEKAELKDRIINLFQNDFANYLFEECLLFEKAKDYTTIEFGEWIKQKALEFAYKHRESVFYNVVQRYEQPQAFECGNISLLVNGNSFLLRDYVLTANRSVRHLSKEIIPFHEPLEVNSNLHTIFKNYKQEKESTLTIRIYIEYEHE